MLYFDHERRVTTTRYFDKEYGFGEVIAQDGDEVLVRFQEFPWYPQWMPLEGIRPAVKPDPKSDQ